MSQRRGRRGTKQSSLTNRTTTDADHDALFKQFLDAKASLRPPPTSPSLVTSNIFPSSTTLNAPPNEWEQVPRGSNNSGEEEMTTTDEIANVQKDELGVLLKAEALSYLRPQPTKQDKVRSIPPPAIVADTDKQHDQIKSDSNPLPTPLGNPTYDVEMVTVHKQIHALQQLRCTGADTDTDTHTDTDTDTDQHMIYVPECDAALLDNLVPDDALFEADELAAEWVYVAVPTPSLAHDMLTDLQLTQPLSQLRDQLERFGDHDDDDDDGGDTYITSEAFLEYGIRCRHTLAFWDALLAFTTVTQRGDVLAKEALWQRHLLFVAVGEPQHALEDLARLGDSVAFTSRVYKSRAFVLASQHEHSAAIDEFNLFLALCPDDPRGYEGRAESLFAINVIDKAFRDLEKLAELVPSRNVLVRCGNYHQQNGQIHKSIREFSAALAVNPTDASLYLVRSKSYLSLNELGAALRDLSQSIHLDPDGSAEAYRLRGVAIAADQPLRALTDLSTSLMLDHSAQNVLGYLHRGLAYMQMSRFNVAKVDFEMVLKFSTPKPKPKQKPQRNNANKINSKNKNNDDNNICNDDSSNSTCNHHSNNISNMDDVLDDDGDDDDDADADDVDVNSLIAAVFAHCQLGLITMLNDGKLFAAILHFTRAINVDPLYSYAYVYRAECYRRIYVGTPTSDKGPAKSLRMGIRDYCRAIMLRPWCAHYYVMRARLLLQLNDHDLAQHDIEAAVKLDQALGTSVLVQAKVTSFMGNPAISIARLRQHIDDLLDDISESDQVVNAKLAPAHALLAEVLIKCEQYEDAICELESALSIEQGASQWWYLLGICFANVCDDDLAIEAFTCTIEQTSSKPKTKTTSKLLVKAHYERGAAMLRGGDKRGIRDINKALSIDQRMWTGYLTRACFYGQQGRTAKAILNCNQAILLQPRSSRAFLTRGCYKHANNYMTGALKDVTTAIDLSDDTESLALCLYNRAILHYEMGEFDLALKDYSKAATLPDCSYAVFHNRAILHFELGNYADALVDFESIADEPEMDDSPELWHAIGTCKHMTGQRQEAIEEFDMALGINPHFVEALVAKAAVFMDVNGFEKHALVTYQKAIMLQHDCMEAYVNLCYGLHSEGRLNDAWCVATLALPMHPHHVGLLEARACVCAARNELAAAHADYTTAILAALRSTPQHKRTPELYINRGVVNVSLEATAAAMDDFRAALHLQPQNALAMFNQGLVYLNTKQFRQAYENFDAAAIAQPNDETFLVARAVARLKVKSKDHQQILLEASYDDLSLAINLSPESFYIRYNRALIALQLKQVADGTHTPSYEGAVRGNKTGNPNHRPITNHSNNYNNSNSKDNNSITNSSSSSSSKADSRSVDSYTKDAVNDLLRYLEMNPNDGEARALVGKLLGGAHYADEALLAFSLASM